MQVKLAKAYGQMIRAARKQAGLTQPRLAAACGTGVRYIVDLEKGKPTCQLGKALWVALNLGIRFELLQAALGSEKKAGTTKKTKFKRPAKKIRRKE